MKHATALAVLALLAACQNTAPVPSQEPLTAAESMALWMEYATPGEAHAVLARFVGSWDAESTFWMEPGAEPMVTKAQIENRMVFGGRYLDGHYTTDFMGMPFEGFSRMGYNNSLGHYEGTWVDNMGTGMLPISHGSYDAATDSITMLREFADPMTGLWTRSRDVTKFITDDEHVFEIFHDNGDGEFLVMKVVYTRR